LNIVCATVRKTAEPRFWQSMRIAMAVGIEARGTVFWIAM